MVVKHLRNRCVHLHHLTKCDVNQSKPSFNQLVPIRKLRRARSSLTWKCAIFSMSPPEAETRVYDEAYWSYVEEVNPRWTPLIGKRAISGWKPIRGGTRWKLIALNAKPSEKWMTRRKLLWKMAGPQPRVFVRHAAPRCSESARANKPAGFAPGLRKKHKNRPRLVR